MDVRALRGTKGLVTRLLTLAVLLASSVALAAPASELCEKHEAKGPCSTTEFDFERIEKACADKGRRGAASEMRMMMLRANQKRAGLACASCHADPDEGHYNLTADARKLAKKHFVETPADR